MIKVIYNRHNKQSNSTPINTSSYPSCYSQRDYICFRDYSEFGHWFIQNYHDISIIDIIDGITIDIDSYFHY